VFKFGDNSFKKSNEVIAPYSKNQQKSNKLQTFNLEGQCHL
jgi:hypothetical protein